MLGYDSERRLLNLFDLLKNSEQDQERRRQRLCSIRDFAPYSAFMRLDRDANDSITALELLNFFRDNREYTISLTDCQDLLDYFDSDSDGRLSLQEVQQMFLPCEDNTLRAIALGRYAFRVGRWDFLPANQEIDLSTLLYHEIGLLRRLKIHKEDLTYRRDYTNYATFRTVDRYNDGFISVENLRHFYRVNGSYLTEKDALSIIRRIDTDGDAKISYNEFADFMSSSSSASAYLRTSNDWRTQSETRPRRNLENSISKENATPLKTKTQPRAKTSEKKPRGQVQFNESHYTPVKKGQSEGRLGMSDLKTADKSYYSFGSPDRNKSADKTYRQIKIEDATVQVLKDFAKQEKELELAKQNLALKPDFNLYDAFKILDIRDYGSVDLYDIKDGLSSIGLYATSDEINLFIKRYDTDKNGKLRFSEFCSALLPVDTYYASILNRRNSNGVRTYYRDDCFSFSTKLALKDLFRLHFQIEKQAEYQRTALNRDPTYDTYEAFKACDINEDGIVTKNEVRRLFEQNGMYASELEVNTLMNKLDKDKDGRVALYEFIEELKPKAMIY